MERFAGFDWDSGNRSKCQKHGVSITEIEGLFAGDPLLATDAKHSGNEMRWRAVGRTPAGRYVFLAFTIRHHEGRQWLRPISARYMHEKEVRRYEEGQS